MNIRKNNKGVTLVELVVSLAILAILMVAIIMVMSSNTVIFKKTKADIQVAGSAQETYDVISDALMQAKKVEAKGYIVPASSTDTITFDPMKKGTSVSAISGLALHTIKKLKGSDDTITEFAELSSYNSATGVTSYTTVYLTELEVTYAVPYEVAYVTDDSAVPTGTEKDECTAKFTFSDGKMNVKYTHKYMDKLNTTDEVFTSQLNKVTVGTVNITGATATFDALNDSAQIDLFFADKNMNYSSKGMFKMRNSFVIQKSKDEITE